MPHSKTKTMRDALIEEIGENMRRNDRIFFLSADMGAPSLDRLREMFKDRFINVGIAEQNLVNVAAGLALEGFVVYAYAIAGFLTMRAYEQIRINLALSSQCRDINVNLVGVGTGISYDMAGPSHHCLEDISVIRTLPNILICSPADWITTKKFVDFSIRDKNPKYIRLDGKALPPIYPQETIFDWQAGFCQLAEGYDTCIVATGWMTHKALRIAEKLSKRNGNIGVIDVFMLRPFNEVLFFETVKEYKTIITLEESFVGKGGLDSLISNILRANNSNICLQRVGFGDTYIFESGNREYLSGLGGFGENNVIELIKNIPAD